jgi:quercetin dioxygenase-like cupin family protein
MNTIQFEKLDLIEAWSKADPTERVNFAFPISGETGANTYTVGYVEIPPDGAIQRHADSSNELILVLEGTVESEVDGDGTGTFGPGTVFQIPANVKHRTANTGGDTARLVLYFDSGENVVTLDDPMMPMDSKVL